MLNAICASQKMKFDELYTTDADEMARRYNTAINDILDRLIPKRSVTCRRPPSDPWFDQECWEAKHRVRRLEYAASKTVAAAGVSPFIAMRPPCLRGLLNGCSLSTFCAFTADDVIAAICRLPDKYCATDPMPTRLLTDIVHHRDVQPISAVCRLCHTIAKKT